MAHTKYYLDLRGKAKDGKGSILISLIHNGTTSTFSTGIRVSPKNWNGHEVVKQDDASALNLRLSDRKSYIDKKLTILSLEDGFDLKNAAQLRKEIEDRVQKKPKGHLISDLFNEYIELGMKPGTREIYEIALRKMLAFGGEKLVIESVDYKWLLQFEKAMSKTQKSANGRSIYLRAIRTIFNYAIHTGVDIKYPFYNFQIKSEQTKKRSITVDLLRKFYSFPTSEVNSMYRDYFFLMFFLIGINIKDLLLAKKSQYDGRRLEYIREKTGKRYSIKVEPEAAALIEKYSGRGEYLLDAMDHCQLYKSFAHQMNDALKNIGEQKEKDSPIIGSLFGDDDVEMIVEPVIPGITTYYSRHTWSTLAYELDIPTDIISQALGHSMGNKTTLIYIKPNQSKVDAANRKVIDYFLGKVSL